MNYDKKKFDDRFERIRKKYTTIYDPQTGEWSGPEYISNLPLDLQEVINISKELEKFDSVEPTETEIELGEEHSNAWDNFELKLFTCLDIYSKDHEKEFYKAFSEVCIALNELWCIAIYDWETQILILTFLEEIDKKRFKKNVEKLWFCMYSITEAGSVREEILINIIMSGVAKEFPYPGYFEVQATKLIEEAKIKGGDYRTHVLEKFKFFI